jgi:hypothetical protein
LLETIESLKERIWLPYWAGLEFHQRRLDVVSEQLDTYEVIKKELTKNLSIVRNSFERHPYLGESKLPDLLQKFVEDATSELATLKARHPNWLQDDPVVARITSAFSGRVGPSYEETTLLSIRKEGERRYAAKIPPGWRDAKKEDARQFGDLIIWKQLVDKAKSDGVPIIFVSDDRKDDWWWVHGGRTIGPLPELVAEMGREAHQRFYMYRPEQFMHEVAQRQRVEAPNEAIAEVVQLRKDRERWRQERDDVVESLRRRLRLLVDTPMISEFEELSALAALLAKHMDEPEVAEPQFSREELASARAKLRSLMRRHADRESIGRWTREESSGPVDHTDEEPTRNDADE